MTAHDELIKRLRANVPEPGAWTTEAQHYCGLAADAIEQLQRDNAALMADGAEQARLAREACERAARYETALSKIVAIEDRQYGGDWDEIAEARAIAYTAL